ncbi:MAG: GNAT family N-acetyltransferase [Methylotenera sp.]|nr:GNAT family N-acetyltransferase [Methylotenera sp.]MDO9233313.1 GNAT family N-acetyltransferase [Methylotenera sp.]MDO9388370.1 GNAT family N-acetyltransferase [Methylotenera sp.]MDP2403041.1 GNAT family N-acetyltransferase [Methylotenera sp.]MDP3096084.1 GNAT family N-acetyltransferase [Methylotenera sp.]
MQHDFNIQFDIQKVIWQTHAIQLKTVREQVFIIEQHVPIALEWDGLDDEALHLLAINDGGVAIGCARLPGYGSIGRMAVLQPWRGLGVGKAILYAAVAQYQQQGMQPITLSAQMHAIPFYQKAGFEVCSEPYLDAGILHVNMRLG